LRCRRTAAISGIRAQRHVALIHGGAGELGAGAHRSLSRGARASAEGRRKDYRGAGVTPEFEGKLECINYMCARIKLHTRNDSVNIRYSAKA
jgi:hypothetical protein